MSLGKVSERKEGAQVNYDEASEGEGLIKQVRQWHWCDTHARLRHPDMSYLLFAGRYHYPEGGFGDFIGRQCSVELLLNDWRDVMDRYEWAEIVDISCNYRVGVFVYPSDLDIDRYHLGRIREFSA